MFSLVLGVLLILLIVGVGTMDETIGVVLFVLSAFCFVIILVNGAQGYYTLDSKVKVDDGSIKQYEDLSAFYIEETLMEGFDFSTMETSGNKINIYNSEKHRQERFPIIMLPKNEKSIKEGFYITEYKRWWIWNGWEHTVYFIKYDEELFDNEIQK